MRELISYLVGVLGNLSIATWVIIMLLAITVGLVVYVRYLHEKPYDVWKHERDSFANDCKEIGQEVATLLIRIAMLSADNNSALALGMIKKEVNDQADDFLHKLPAIVENIKASSPLPISNDEYMSLLNNVGAAIRTGIKFGKFRDLFALAEFAVAADHSEKGLRDSVYFLEGRLKELKPKE